jgi:hypothetical protein
MIRIGEQAPDFELESDDGGTVRLSDLRGNARRPLFLPEGRHERHLQQYRQGVPA